MKKIESLYIHFPFCTHLCNYCDFYKKVTQDKVQDFEKFHGYMQSAFEEHKNLMKEYGYSWGNLKTLYLGGGTPSLWGKEGKIFLEKFFAKNNLTLASDCEFTMEVNPGAWNEEVLELWESLGVNRYSLGIQSLDGTLSKYLDRVHTIDDVYNTLEFFHKKKANFSVDFMLGLPYSELLKRDVVNELEQALKYSPTHFSVYILTVKDNYTHFSKLPNEEWIENEYMQVSNFLTNKGFVHYEVSNFAIPTFESKHNLSYWHSLTVGALGPSATGFLAESRVRYKWQANNAKYDLEQLNQEEYELEKIYMALRSKIGLDLNLLEELQSQKILAKWIPHGWAVLDNQRKLQLTSRGFLLLDSLMNDLFSFKVIK